MRYLRLRLDDEDRPANENHRVAGLTAMVRWEQQTNDRTPYAVVLRVDCRLRQTQLSERLVPDLVRYGCFFTGEAPMRVIVLTQQCMDVRCRASIDRPTTDAEKDLGSDPEHTLSLASEMSALGQPGIDHVDDDFSRIHVIAQFD
nr:hypothetical protein CFP56_00543 [Quercus suber]